LPKTSVKLVVSFFLLICNKSTVHNTTKLSSAIEGKT